MYPYSIAILNAALLGCPLLPCLALFPRQEHIRAYIVHSYRCFPRQVSGCFKCFVSSFLFFILFAGRQGQHLRQRLKLAT